MVIECDIVYTIYCIYGNSHSLWGWTFKRRFGGPGNKEVICRERQVEDTQYLPTVWSNTIFKVVAVALLRGQSHPSGQQTCAISNS